MMLIKHYLYMQPKDVFWNRKLELNRIRSFVGKSGFGYVSGRRRIGKTALLRKAFESFGGIYHQAVEGTAEQQLIHLAEELGEPLPLFKDVVPKTWNEFFRLLSKEKLPKLIVFDEFPYWIQSDPALASLFQKWIDHDLPKFKTSVLVSGSSQAMLYSQFLQQGSPLYGRTTFKMHLESMSYAWFCRALKHPISDPTSFMRFSLVGGVPHYWKLMSKGSVVAQAEELYFASAAILAEEPAHWIRDEGITGNLPKAILDLVGRGVSKPSELASRLGTAQGNLSRPLALLLDLGFIQREMPFGESIRSTKKVLYGIQDPALAFYYGTFLPYRTRWPQMSPTEKMKLLERHASKRWEYFCKAFYPGSGRYWEGGLEIDLVALIKPQHYLIGECKWKFLSVREEKKLLKGLQEKFQQSRLRRKLKRAAKLSFRVFSKRDLGRLAHIG